MCGVNLAETSVAIVFDESNVNWSPNPTANHLFLKGISSHMNNVLAIRDHVFLNDIYDALRAPRTKAGALAGWFRSEGNLSRIVFDIEEIGSNRYAIDFNIDGIIYDKLP